MPEKKLTKDQIEWIDKQIHGNVNSLRALDFFKDKKLNNKEKINNENVRNDQGRRKEK